MIEPKESVGFVLAGGQSRRMGRDKALLPFAGEPLIARAVGILERAGLKTWIAGERPDLVNYAPVVPDRVHSQGPLAGVCAALDEMEGRWGVFLPVDMPLLPPALIAHMVQRAQNGDDAITIASLAGKPQTFPAVIDRAALPALRAELGAGRLKCIDAFRGAAAALGQPVAIMAADSLVQTGDVVSSLAPAQWFLNVNSEDELRNAESLARHLIA